MSGIKLNWRSQLVLLAIFLLSLLLYFLGKQISQEEIQTFLESTGPWAPIVWILAHQLSYILAPVSGFPFLIVGFYLFGDTTILYNFIVVITGSSINFLIAKRWGRPIVKRLAGEEPLAKIDKFSREYGLGMLFVLRMFLIGLGDFISYAYGLTPIRYTTFIIISAIAMIPGYVLWYSVALRTGSIEQFLGVSVALTFIAFWVFVGGSYIWKKLKK
ncbi:TVP38/TMEM64 family protein [Candidatus Curtissbacteria bacterium]|nr:TVP38/TMEM64 family protein [Candidatus Curtissbacteria bacterium]